MELSTYLVRQLIGGGGIRHMDPMRVYFYWTAQNSLSVWRRAWILRKTQLSIKIVFQVTMSRRKEVKKGKQQLDSLQRVRNLDDKWQ